ncbi:MAG: hypothetical protein ACP5O0_05155, partial [Acidimicrobiales bacterium]
MVRLEVSNGDPPWPACRFTNLSQYLEVIRSGTALELSAPTWTTTKRVLTPTLGVMTSTVVGDAY